MVPVSTPNTNGQDGGKSPAHTCDPSEDPLPFADQVKQQNNAATQEQAVQHLLQVFEDTMNRAGNDRSDETVRSLLDKVVPPLVQVYLEASNTTDEPTKTQIIKLLADSRDERARPALIKAIKDYRSNRSGTDFKVAAQAIAAMRVRDPEAMDALIAAFVRFQAGSTNTWDHYVDTMNVMVAVSHPSWVPTLIERLNRPMSPYEWDEEVDEKKTAAYRSEQFWQVTAADVLGEIRSPDAVRALFKIVVDPNKSDVAPRATTAMVKIGKPSMSVLVDALLGKDRELLTFARTKVSPQVDAPQTVVRSAAKVLGAIGRSDGVEPLLRALGRAKRADHATRTVIAHELANCPPSDKSFKAYVATFESIPAMDDVQLRAYVMRGLAKDMARFYDRRAIDVLIRHVDRLRGAHDEKEALGIAALSTMTKLMHRDQIEAVDAAMARWVPSDYDNSFEPERLDKDALDQSKKLLAACEERIDCYLAKLDDPVVREWDPSSTGIKASYMLAMLGDETTALEIVRRLPGIRNPGIKEAAILAVERLCPNGSQLVADAIEEQLKASMEKGDHRLIARDGPWKRARYRLLARLD